MKRAVCIICVSLLSTASGFSQYLENPFSMQNGLSRTLLSSAIDSPTQGSGSQNYYPTVMNSSSNVSLAIPQLRNRSKEQELGIGVVQFGLDILSKGRWNQINTQHLYYPKQIRTTD